MWAFLSVPPASHVFKGDASLPVSPLCSPACVLAFAQKHWRQEPQVFPYISVKGPGTSCILWLKAAFLFNFKHRMRTGLEVGVGVGTPTNQTAILSPCPTVQVARAVVGQACPHPARTCSVWPWGLACALTRPLEALLGVGGGACLGGRGSRLCWLASGPRGWGAEQPPRSQLTELRGCPGLLPLSWHRVCLPR